MEWTKIEDGKPHIAENCEWSKSVIAYNGVVDDNVRMNESGEFWWHPIGYDHDSQIVDNVTHWMYLPLAPEK